MSEPNTEWVIAQLEDFVDLSTTCYRNTPDMDVHASHRGSADLIAASWAVVKQILDRLNPGWSLSEEISSSYESEWKKHRDAAVQFLAVFQRRKEIEANLGDGSPTLSASELHTWVWDGARALWQSGHYRSAVEDAAKKVNAETQNKLGRRDISETKLFQQAFSTSPATVAAKRLRRIPPEGSDTYSSLQRGAMALAEGIYAGIRNPLNHEAPQDLDEQVALEYLASLSVLARWVDTSAIESVP